MIASTTMPASSIVATLTGSNSPSSQITIYRTTAPSATAPSTCIGGSWTTVGTASVSADGNFNPSGSGFSPGATTGNYWWYASFAADTNDKAANTPCPSSTVTTVAASKATPALTVSAPTVATTGVSIPVSAISATISGSLAASGPITIYAYFGAANPTTCPGGAGWTTVGTVTPSGNGTYNPSGGLASPATGTYWWYASFAGDSTNNAKNTLCNTSAMTKTTVAAFSGAVSSVKMLDNDHDGKVDEIDVLFSVSVLCTASCSDGWSVSNIPSGGTLSSVTVSSNTAQLMIAEGAGAANTAVGTLTVALAAPGGITDSAGRYASFASTIPTDAAPPVITSLVSLQSAGTAGNGKMEAGDKLVVTFSEPVTGVPASPAVSETRPSSGNVTLSIGSFTTGANTGSTGYLAAKNTAISSTGATALSVGNTTVTITLGAVSGTGTAAASTGALAFTQLGTIKDAAGNAAVTTFTTPSSFALF
jgi:hypothetical protein